MKEGKVEHRQPEHSSVGTQQQNDDKMNSAMQAGCWRCRPTVNSIIPTNVWKGFLFRIRQGRWFSNSSFPGGFMCRSSNLNKNSLNSVSQTWLQADHDPNTDIVVSTNLTKSLQQGKMGFALGLNLTILSIVNRSFSELCNLWTFIENLVCVCGIIFFFVVFKQKRHLF